MRLIEKIAGVKRVARQIASKQFLFAGHEPTMRHLRKTVAGSRPVGKAVESIKSLAKEVTGKKMGRVQAWLTKGTVKRERKRIAKGKRRFA